MHCWEEPGPNVIDKYISLRYMQCQHFYEAYMYIHINPRVSGFRAEKFYENQGICFSSDSHHLWVDSHCIMFDNLYGNLLTECTLRL